MTAETLVPGVAYLDGARMLEGLRTLHLAARAGKAPASTPTRSTGAVVLDLPPDGRDASPPEASAAQLVRLVRRLPMVSVALLDGPVTSVWAAAALACDVLLVAPGAALELIDPVTGGPATVAFRLVVESLGPDRTKRLLLTDGGRLDARALVATGLGTEAPADDAALRAWATQLVERARPATVDALRVLDRACGLTLEQVLDWESDITVAALGDFEDAR